MSWEDLRARALRLWPGVAAALLVILALVPRFVSLDSRPVIHDESMFAFYSFSFLERDSFTHVPLLHGPSLILLTGSVFAAFGDSMEVARAFIACCSLVAMAACLALAPSRFRWWFAPLLLTSPILLYFSRFLRNEMLFNAVLMLGLLGVVQALRPGRWRPAWAVLGVGALVSLAAIKENSLFVYASGATFAGLWLAMGRLGFRTAETDPKGPAAGTTAASPAPPARAPGRIALACGWLGGLLLGLGVVGFVYGLTLPPTHHYQAIRSVVDDDPQRVSAIHSGRETLPLVGRVRVLGGLMSRSWINIRASLDYWTGQHTEHRIRGALHYHLPILLTYELPLLLLLGIGLFRDARSQRGRPRFYLGGYGIWLLTWLAWRGIDATDALGPLERLQDFLHIGPTASMMVLGLIITPTLVWSLLSLSRGQVIASWMGWWTACSLFQYSSAGEKVPWLAVHIALPMYLMLIWLWTPQLEQLGRRGLRLAAWVVIAASLVALRNDVYLIGERSADARERLVYNHTPRWVQEYVDRRLAIWQEDEEQKRIPLDERKVLLVGGPGWPGTWYFRHCRYRLVPRSRPLTQVDPDVDLVLGELAAVKAFRDGPRAADWIVTEGSMRDHWWAPWPEESSWWPTPRTIRQRKPLGERLGSSIAGLWRYYWWRETWTEPGGFPIVAFESRRRR